MKLITINGFVTYLMEAGCNLVTNTVTEKKADEIIARAATVEESSKYPGYNRVVDGRYYFNVLTRKKGASK